jgi:hypothetical protein
VVQVRVLSDVESNLASFRIWARFDRRWTNGRSVVRRLSSGASLASEFARKIASLFPNQQSSEELRSGCVVSAFDDDSSHFCINESKRHHRPLSHI